MTPRRLLCWFVGGLALFAIWNWCWIPFECNKASKALESAVEAASRGDASARAFLSTSIGKFVAVEMHLPQDQALNVSIATVFSLMGRNDDALAVYEKALVYDQRPEIYFNMAAIYRRQGLVEKAYDNYLYAARFNPDLAGRIGDESLRFQVETELRKRSMLK